MLNEFEAALARSGEARGGEPDWIPSPEAVARARARLERQGVVRALMRSRTRPSVLPGEAPWIWWGAAALWVLAWPAAITLSLSSGLPDWLPLWLLFGLAVVHMALLALPVLLSERAAGRSALRKSFGRVRTLDELLALEPAEFEVWSGMLFRLMGYRVVNTHDTGDHGVDLAVSNEQVRSGLVQCKRYRGTVGEPVVRDLFGTMVHANADRGWLLTTGAISRQAREWCYGKPIELWDGQSLLAQAKRYA